MGKFRYKVELIEQLPDCMNKIDKVEEVEAKKEWFGHSLGNVVGRIYADGRVESFFNHDIETGKPEWFEMLRESGKLRQRHRCYVNRNTWEEYECEEFYLMRRVVGHTSGKPTVTDMCIDGCMNVEYEYVYEILLVADEGLKRYVTDTIRTEGSGAYCLADVMSSLEETFDEWATEEKEGFRFWGGQLNVDFYDDFGETIDIDFPCMNELMNCINSVRIVDMKRTIINRDHHLSRSTT